MNSKETTAILQGTERCANKALETKKKENVHWQQRDMFQGNSKKSSNNSLKFGVPTPSKRGSRCQLFRTTLPFQLTCNRIPTFSPREENSAVG
jgi:hypothetical protein